MKINHWMIGLLLIALAGCTTTEMRVGENGKPNLSDIEAAWIRDGEPIEFEGELWYPQDEIDILLDNEVFRLGEYRGEDFFIEKVDVRPYNRLYTKFGRNQFRIYRERNRND